MEPAAGTLAAAGLAPGDGDLTVVQFNIRRGRDTDLAHTAACLEGAELAGLNEIAGGDWFDDRTQAELLGERLNLAWLFVPSETRWWREHFGNALLSALPLTRWERIPLPWEASKSRRSRLEGVLDWQGRSINLLVTHLDSGPDRELQLADLAGRFAALPAPKLLLGDLNTRADHPVLAAWEQDPDLIVIGAPNGVDWIVAAGFTLLESWQCDQGASDHPALGARLEPRF